MYSDPHFSRCLRNPDTKAELSIYEPSSHRLATNGNLGRTKRSCGFLFLTIPSIGSRNRRSWLARTQGLVNINSL